MQILALVYCTPVAIKFFQSSDWVKFAFFVLNPALCELIFILPQRLAARALANNHPSTSYLFLSYMIVNVKMVGRVMMSTVRNPNLAVTASCVSAFLEFAFRISLPFRDKLFYKWLLARYLSHGEDACSLQKSSRSKVLSAHVSALETMCELIAVWSSFLLVVLYDIDTSGKSMDRQERTLKALQGAILATLFELIADFLSLLVLRKALNIPMVKQAQGRRWYWSLPTTCVFWWSSDFFSRVLVSRFLCRPDAHSNAAWVVCT